MPGLCFGGWTEGELSGRAAPPENMNSFIVALPLPSQYSSKGIVKIGKAKIQPKIIIYPEALFKKAM